MAKDRQFYMDLTRKYARANKVPEQLLLAQYNQESRFNPTARSYADARGIAQIVPKWHPDVNPNMEGNQLPGVNPEWDIAYGARLMSGHYKRYGSWERALSAYNSGKPDAYKDPNFAKGQTYNYVKKIMSTRGQFAPGKSDTFGDEQASMTLPEVSSSAGDTRKKAMAQWIMENNRMISQGQLPTANLKMFQLANEVRDHQQAGFDGGEADDPGVSVEPGQLKGQPYERVIQAIKYAQALGLRVSENPYVDKVDPVHTEGSHHYQTYKGTNIGKAMDVSGDPAKLKALFSYLQKNYGGSLNDMFYTPMGYSFDDGKRWDSVIKNHENHLHASFY